MAIDLEDEDAESSIMKDIAPFILLEDTAMSKLHFLFIMLNISQVNIINQGTITGIITKLEFLKKRKEEAKLLKEERDKQRIINTLTAGVSAIATFGANLTPFTGRKSESIAPKKPVEEQKEALLEPHKQNA